MDGAGIFLLAGFDAKWKMILPGRQGAGGEVGEGTWRAVRFVEINDDLA